MNGLIRSYEHTEVPKDVNLYHYTSSAGLIGMKQSKSLWFTNIAYLNDESEYIFAIDTIKEYIKKNYDQSLYNNIIDAINHMPSIPSVFTFSLTEEKDLLSQWRGYCPNGGYSVSFDKEQLNRMIMDNNLTIKKCLYEKQEIEVFIERKIVGQDPYLYNKSLVDYRTKNSKAMSFLPEIAAWRLFQLAPFIKHHSFKEEKEWRVINNNFFQSSLEKIPNLEFREGKNFLIPFIQVPLNKAGEDNQIKIVDAIVERSPQVSLSLAACKAFLLTDSVAISDIPYRNW